MNSTTKLVMAVIVSIGISLIAFFIAPVINIGLLFFGIAQLPTEIVVIVFKFVVIAATITPGLIANLYLTRGLPAVWRITLALFYLAIFWVIATVILDTEIYKNWITPGPR